MREADPLDTTLVQGLPVASFEKTLADLVQDGHDLGDVADAMSDALRQSQLNDDRLVELLGPTTRSRGFAPGDGESLLRKLKEMANVSGDPAVSVMSDVSPAVAKILETTASVIARNSDLARGVLRDVRLAELPTWVSTMRDLQAVAIPEPAVKELMESATKLVEALHRKRIGDDSRL